MLNKVFLFIAVICIVWCTSCSEEPLISITLKGFTNDTIVIGQVSLAEYPDVKNDSDPRIKWDTIVVQHSAVTFRPADTISLYAIIPCQSSGENLKMIVAPHDRIDIHMDFSHDAVTYTTKGSPIADAINDYNLMMNEITEQIRRARKKVDTPQELLDSLYGIRMEKSATWVKSHIDNPALALYFNRMSPDSVVSYYSLLSAEILNSEVGPLLKSAYLRADKYIKIMNAKDYIREGVTAPDFTLQNNEGKHFTLSSLRGKWVVLDFWGSWCGWCIKGIPDMKKSQARLADKCEFVSIACNDKYEEWLRALEKYDMPWTQLYVPTNHPADLDPATLYAIQGYPTKIIVNPDGVIAKIFIGESAECYQEVNELVK